MAALAMDKYAGTPDELLERARLVAKTPESAELLLAAVNKQLAEIAPGEEPYAAAKRLTAERDEWAIRVSYRLLNEYYDKSLDAQSFSVSFEDMDHKEHVALAEDMLWYLRGGIG